MNSESKKVDKEKIHSINQSVSSSIVNFEFFSRNIALDLIDAMD